jgi:hypothetical protein
MSTSSRIFPMFSCNSFKYYIKIFDTFCNDFCIGGVITGQFQSSACRYLIFQGHVLKMLSSLHCIFLFLCRKSDGSLFSVFISVFSILFHLAFFTVILLLFLLLSLQYNLKSSIMIPPALLFLLLLFRVFCFRINFSTSAKVYVAILMATALTQ